MEQPGGPRVVVDVNIDPLRDAEGRLIGAINVFEDITERKHAEVKMNVLPLPGSLCTLIEPPISITSCWTMESPRPVPPYLRVVELSACSKAWKNSTSTTFSGC